MRARILPGLILIGDRFTDPNIAERIVAAVAAGVPWVHLRDHRAEAGIFGQEASRLLERLRTASPGVALSVNARLDVARCLNVHFHTGSQGPSPGQARDVLGPSAWIGYSAHEAVAPGADYLFFSPIFHSASKPHHPGLGVAELRAFCRTSAPDVPVFALGGITANRVVVCLEAGAHGVAVASGILDAPDPEEAASAYLAALKGHAL